VRRTEDGLHSDRDSSEVSNCDFWLHCSQTCGKYIPRSTGKAFNQFEKFNEISSVATFLQRLNIKLAKSIIIWQASKFRKQTSESMLDSLKQFNVLDIVWIPNG